MQRIWRNIQFFFLKPLGASKKFKIKENLIEIKRNFPNSFVFSLQCTDLTKVGGEYERAHAQKCDGTRIFLVPVPVLIFGTKFFQCRLRYLFSVHFRYTFSVTNFSGTSSGTYFLYNLCYSRIFQNYKELENYSTGWFFLTSVGAVYFTPAPAPGFHFFGQNWIISEAESNWKRSCQKYFLIDLWVGWMKLQEAAQLHWRQKIV